MDWMFICASIIAFAAIIGWLRAQEKLGRADRLYNWLAADYNLFEDIADQRIAWYKKELKDCSDVLARTKFELREMKRGERVCLAAVDSLIKERDSWQRIAEDLKEGKGWDWEYISKLERETKEQEKKIVELKAQILTLSKKV